MHICVKNVVLVTLLAAVMTLASAPRVSAQSFTSLEQDNLNNSILKTLFPEGIGEASTEVVEQLEEEAPLEEEKSPEPKVYIVVKGDYLDKIAKDESTTWLRLWQKNQNIKHPDRINIGDKLIIPAPEEELEDRPLPKPPVAVLRPEPSPRRGNTQKPVRTAVRGSSGGNLYTAGYCTWYVKNRRPDLPNNLGNAHTWFSKASAQGLPVGHAPRTGSVGVSTRGSLGHVVYVEGVNGDGTVNISEMNFRGLYNITRRTVAASSFVYIY